MRDYFVIDMVWLRDYYPFGAIMPDRHSSSDYRYSFQNQECDQEIYGEGNAYAFEYRMHDPRLGRFWSIDPLAAKYPYNSPYAFSENSTIAFIELEGLEKFYSADMKYLGSYSNNDDIMVMKDNYDDISDDFGNKDYDYLMGRSQKAYTLDQEDELIKKWGEVNKPKSKFSERGFMIWKNQITDADGNKVTILLEGSTAVGPTKEEEADVHFRTVDITQSKLKIRGEVIAELDFSDSRFGEVKNGDTGWKPYHAVHVHPSGGSTNLSYDRSGDGFASGDINFAMNYGVKMSMMHWNQTFLKTFDISTFKKNAKKEQYKYDDELNVKHSTKERKLFIMD
jgi:RHS repeat-associated protein